MSGKRDETRTWKTAFRKALLGRDQTAKDVDASVDGKRMQKETEGKGAPCGVLESDENGNWVLGGEPVKFYGISTSQTSGTREHGKRKDTDKKGKEKGRGDGREPGVGEGFEQSNPEKQHKGSNGDGLFGKLFHRSRKSPARDLHSSGSDSGPSG